MSSEWIEAHFPAAGRGKVVERDGFTNCAGLGVFLEAEADPPGEIDWCDDIWCICHLNTGHAIARVEGQRIAAFRLAEEIAGLGDWTFVGVTDWQANQPDLPQKVADAVSEYTKRGAFMLHKGHDVVVANAVYTARLPSQADDVKGTT